MSIVEQFAGRNKRKEPPMVTPARPVAPHEKHAEAVAFLADISAEAHALRNENAQLRADLNLAHLRIRDLEKVDAERRFNLEAYRRYSVEVKTHLQHIVDCANRANEAALEAGEQHAASDASVEAIKLIEGDIKKVAENFGADSTPTV